MTVDVKYKRTKRYNTAKYPIRQPLFFVWLIWVLSKIMLLNKKHKVEKINMEGLKPPYILLSNHMSFIDFELVALGTYPYRVNNVVNIDGYYMRPWLMELIGAICTRKFTMDMHLIRSIRRVLKRGDILCMYPEARYSPAGVESYIPESVGMLVKSNKVPVVVALHRGNYLHAPFWNFRKKRKSVHHTTLTQVLSVDDVNKMSVDEINKALKEALTYDEYKYQRENCISITHKQRAEGMHKILYCCPSCKAESQMDSKGDEIFCKSCHKRWRLNENGTLVAINGETEFSHVPDWFRWEREELNKNIRSGEYHFEDEVDVYSMPGCWEFVHLGRARLTHDFNNGFILEGEYNGEKYRIHRTPLQTNSLHVEYDFQHVKPLDCIDISTENDSFYCYPLNHPNVATKLAFATEIIYEEHIKTKRANHEKMVGK